MPTMLIAFNGTRENGNFMGDQICYLKVAYLLVQNQPDVDKVVIALSPKNEMGFLWEKFCRDPKGDGSLPPCQIVYDTFDPGDWPSRWAAWDKWRAEREIEGIKFDHYRELYLRIHGAQRQNILCGFERGLGRRNIYEYVFYGQEHMPDECQGADWFDDSLIDHPPLAPDRDVYISPHCKTQGNLVFTFDYWARVIQKLIAAGVTVTVGYDGAFCDDITSPLFRKHWGSHKQWMEQVCRHKIVACGNTGTGWLAAACGVPLLTMEPPGSQMPDHRYRECGLRNLVEVLDTPDADYCAKRLIEEVQRVVVMTTGCYDVIHAGHIRHLEKSKSLGTKLIVALNSDTSVKRIKGQGRPINSQEQRKAVLEALRCVDEVRIFDGDDATDLIKAVKPNVLTNGFGYTLDRVVGRSLVEGYGGCVVITCQGDASAEPSTTKIVQRVLRSGDVAEICRVGAGISVNPFEKLKLMAEHFLKVSHLPGDVADLGAYRGGVSLILHRLAPDKQLHLFDTWEGTPIDDPLCHHKKGEWRASFEDCQKIVGNGPMTNYLRGCFPNTTAGLEHNEFCFVYIDPDTYQAVKDAIEFFWPRLVSGGKLFFDDYGWGACAGVKKAVDEAFAEDQRSVVQSLYSCVVTKP